MRTMEEVYPILDRLTRKYFDEKKANDGEATVKTKKALRRIEVEWREVFLAEWDKMPDEDLEVVRELPQDTAIYCDGSFHWFYHEKVNHVGTCMACNCE